ncbi:MAG TPA: transferrin-binding protein-like solute binding protein [Rhodocyclaceae bacterium]|nr:transferrin-binding protein-like solute binding protein [Rhodocyclaceae bacterium]
MKLKMIAASIAALAAASAWADSINEWGYWSANSSQTTVPGQTTTTGPALAFKVADKNISGSNTNSGSGTSSTNSDTDQNRRDGDHGRDGSSNPVVTFGNLPTTIIQNVNLPTTSATSNDWTGYAVTTDSHGQSISSDDNLKVGVGANWKAGDVPKSFTFNVDGQTRTIDLSTANTNRVAGDTYFDYYSASSSVDVSGQVGSSSFTVGRLISASTPARFIAGIATSIADIQALAAGPSVTYLGGSYSRPQGVQLTVNFANASWTGTWTGYSSANSFTAAGTVSGANIRSTSIASSSISGLDAAASSVKATFYGQGAAALGGVSVIKSSAGTERSLFMACKSGNTTLIACNS